MLDTINRATSAWWSVCVCNRLPDAIVSGYQTICHSGTADVGAADTVVTETLNERQARVLPLNELKTSSRRWKACSLNSSTPLPITLADVRSGHHRASSALRI